MRRAFTWTEHQREKLSQVKTVLEELEAYKPLTLRQVYYQLVGKGYIENTVSQYGMLSRLLKYARLSGEIAWDEIEDRVRAYHDLTGWPAAEDYVEAAARQFLSGYRRDLLQGQDVYLELWIEKDALSSIFTKAAMPYTVPVVVCRGFSSVSFLNDFRERLADQEGKQAVMLYFGDFDPSGMEMLTAMETTLRDEMGVDGLEFERVALLVADIKKYKLPHNPDALKRSDSRAKKHVEAYGELAVELDALRPDVLVTKIRKAIEGKLDLDLLAAERKKEQAEVDKLSKVRDRVRGYIEANWE